jgi:hypothetical protein
MAVNIKRVVLDDVTSCGLRQAYQRCGPNLKAVSFPECQVLTAFMSRISFVQGKAGGGGTHHPRGLQ